MKRLLIIMVLSMSVLFVNGQMDTTHNKTKMQHTTVKVTDLPKAVTESITKDYPGYNMTEAYTAMMSDGLHYHVVVTKGTDTQTVVYDKDGKFLKKLLKKEY